MTYETNDGWKFYERVVKLKNGESQTINFFSQRIPKCGTPRDLPEDTKVMINRRTGFPYLVKK